MEGNKVTQEDSKRRAMVQPAGPRRSREGARFLVCFQS